VAKHHSGSGKRTALAGPDLDHAGIKTSAIKRPPIEGENIIVLTRE